MSQGAIVYYLLAWLRSFIQNYFLPLFSKYAKETRLPLAPSNQEEGQVSSLLDDDNIFEYKEEIDFYIQGVRERERDWTHKNVVHFCIDKHNHKEFLGTWQ